MLAEGLRGEVSLLVNEENTALAYGSGLVPVFATPAMIGLMEAAAVACVEAGLELGTTTVGTAIQVSHLAATPLGMAVRAQAELLKVEGRQLTFKVQAFDAVEQIGQGTHQRIIVQTKKFLERAQSKHPEDLN